MDVIQTTIPDVLIIEPKVFGDDRGFFMESFNEKTFREKTGVTTPFVQDNHSRSAKNVLRGLHYQIKQAQGKLVRVVLGEVYDVAVDIRKSSPTFGQWVGCILSEANKKQFWVPPGFAHGFVVLSDTADFITLQNTNVQFSGMILLLILTGRSKMSRFYRLKIRLEYL
jgi:dTDP-4-dehydrorhamnose 3,5-epimerase